MGSEVFKLKSLPMDDTVVRGSRINAKNAKETRTVLVNPPYDDPVLKTGEIGINAEYIVQASLIGNDLKGYGTFVNNSDVVQGYIGPQDIKYGDIVRLDTDITFYTVTGMQGTDLYLQEKFVKKAPTDPDQQTGVTTVRKVKLDSATYETVKSLEPAGIIFYDNTNTVWGATGMQLPAPTVATKAIIPLDTGMSIQFQTGVKRSKPDILTVGSVYKTVVDNNTTPVSDVSLSPLPYPHESLKVYIAKPGEALEQKVELEDYAVNYTQSPEYRTPRPPYEEREGAYIKFLDKLTDEVQVPAIDATFEGNVSLVKKSVQNNANLLRPIGNIIPSDSFEMKAGGEKRKVNVEYVPDYDAGIVRFVKHENSEPLIDSITYVKKLIWDGMSVIKGVGYTGVQNMDSLVIPPISGIAGTIGMVYYEDTDQNNLIRDIDYVIDPESGAFRLESPLKETESVLVSYYVEGEDVEAEPVALNDMRVNKYPVITGSVTITEKYRVTEDSKEVTKTKVLIENQDFSFSYITGRISSIDLIEGQEILSLEASYTPMAQVNVVLQTVPGDSLKYRMTIINDVIKVVTPGVLTFQLNNPMVSVPAKVTFKEDVTDSNYTFSGTVLPDSLLWVKNESGTVSYDVRGYAYYDVKEVPRQLVLDQSLSDSRPDLDELIVATYSFESERLPYTPAIIINSIFNTGDDYFLIEGFDRTDVLKSGMILRIDNFDPEHTLYYKIQSVTYEHGTTTVKLWGIFPETIINPTFYLFDDGIDWLGLPSGTEIDTATPVMSETIVLTGNPLHIKNDIKKNSLLLINDEQVYTVMAVDRVGLQSTLTIFPALQEMISGSIQYSSLPVHNTGDENLSAKYFIMTDPTQPAFTLSYQAPAGFEGSASILVDTEKVLIIEAIRGIKNPEAYIYPIADYATLYDLAKAIQGTASTFNKNLPWVKVPDYNPFTIFPAGSIEEEYYLSPGPWSTDLIIPFEDDTPLTLPYTFKIIPELFKWSLLQAYVTENSFLIKNTDRRPFFVRGNLLAFRNTLDGKLYFFEVSGAELVADKVTPGTQNTKVNLTDTFRQNLLNPTAYKYDSVSWEIIDDTLTSVDLTRSELTFRGLPQGNLRKSTMLKIADAYIYQVSELTVGSNSYTVKVIPDLNNSVKLETYNGYVRQSSIPIYLDDIGPQPYMSIQYTSPVGHVGTAEIRVQSDRILIRETIDNFDIKSFRYEYKNYNSIPELAAAIQDAPSYVADFKPFTVTIPDRYLPELQVDNFDNYKIKTTDGEFVSLSRDLQIAVSSFSVQYTTPTGHVGRAEVSVLPTEIILKETIEAYQAGRDVSKETRIAYSSTQSLSDLATRAIPAVSSLVSATLHPFSCTLLNTELFDAGLWSSTHVVSMSEDAVEAPTKVMGTVDGHHWYALGPLNERRLVPETDYEIETGSIVLTEPIVPLDRFRMSYMGLWSLEEYEGSAITCSCRYFTDLPMGSRVDVYMDYLNIDQFYLQKLTERKFSEIVVKPQIGEILDQLGSGGQSSDNGADSNATPNWQGGSADLYYLLRDEQIKIQLYLRFYQWYKRRLRDFSAELQLTVGFKFGHSNALGLDDDNNYTLDDEFVETEDYTLTSENDLDQIKNGFSKFFPVGYEDTAPKYYDRFGPEYTSYNEVYCCNVIRTNRTTNAIETVGIVKSEHPYWLRDLDFSVWDNVSQTGVGSYVVDVPLEDRVFRSGTYTFLKRIEVGDKIRVHKFKDYYEIAEIVAPAGKDYEYLVLTKPFVKKKKKSGRNKRRKGIKTFDIHLVRDDRPFHDHTKMVSVLKKYMYEGQADDVITFEELLDSLPPDGFKISVQRQEKESFPMADDYGSLGASAIGEDIDGHITNTRRIKKPMLAALLKLLFPFIPDLPPPPANFKIQVMKDSESGWEDLPSGQVDMSKLTFKDKRNVDDVMDSLRFDFTQVGVLPPVPLPGFPTTPKPIYDNLEKDDLGFHRYFYLSFDKVYDADSPGGYYDGIIIRAKNREWWFRVVNGGDQDIIEDYGFDPSKEYRNFYDPECMYKRVLIEKQAWETEELILKDLYDHSDKIARAFDQGNLNKTNSKYQGYLAQRNVTDLFSTTFTVETVDGVVSDSLVTGLDVPSGIIVFVSSSGADSKLPTPLKNDVKYTTVNTGLKRCELSINKNRVNITDSGKGSFSITQTNPSGISDILRLRIPAYEKQLAFLINVQGPVNQILYPDFVHPEDSASPAIATTFQKTSIAWNIYNGAWSKEQFYKNLNNINNDTWRNDYVKWVLSLVPGVIYQKDARQMSDTNAKAITVGLREFPALKIVPVVGGPYATEDATVTVTGDFYGKYIQLTFTVVRPSDPTYRVEGVTETVKLYDQNPAGGVIYKKLDAVRDAINATRFDGTQLFTCSNAFEHFENNVVSNMAAVSGLSIDPVLGVTLTVTTVLDDRASDPRVLFLSRGIEDVAYMHGKRELPGLSITYLGSYYAQSLNKEAIAIRLTGSVYAYSFSFSIGLDYEFHKLLFLKLILPSSVEETTYTFSFFNLLLNRYKTLQELVDEINAHTAGSIRLFEASLRYAESPFGELTTEYMSLSDKFIDAVYTSTGFECVPYVQVNDSLNLIDDKDNRSLYRVYIGDDFKKKLEFKFDKVYKDGSEIVVDTTTDSVVFTFELQNPDMSYKTLEAVASEITAKLYLGVQLFDSSAVFVPNSTFTVATAEHIVAENVYKYIESNLADTLYVDTRTADITDPTNALSLLSCQNAYYSFPMYTSNGNARKSPIDGIPVSGVWSTTENEPVLQIDCSDGTTWEATYNDFDSGSYKDYNPAEIVQQIDRVGYVTESQYTTIENVDLNQPQVSVIKELVLRRIPYVDATVGSTNVLKVNLRKYNTIAEVVRAINSSRFNEQGQVQIFDGSVPADPTYDRKYFTANVVGDNQTDLDARGSYKSYELDAVYTPIVRSFFVEYPVTGSSPKLEPKVDKLIGWEITTVNRTVDQPIVLNMAAKRYSPGDTYGFTMNAPDVSYLNTLNNNPRGYRKDTLAFDIYCWDDSGYYEVKDNWIYFRSTKVGYSEDGDIGQPDKSIGCGIPLAGALGYPELATESIGELVDRINQHSVVRKWFYCNLNFTRYSNKGNHTVDPDPGFFEYGYLPNYSADVPKSRLDSIMLRNDFVMTLRPGAGYQFTTSAYTVDDMAETLDLSCDWTYNYLYEKEYILDDILYDTVSELAAAINIDTSAQLGASVFEANVVGSHGTDATTDIEAGSGVVAEVDDSIQAAHLSGALTVSVLTSEFIVPVGDWQVNDVVRLTTTGTLPFIQPPFPALPTPLVSGIDYYVVSVSGTTLDPRVKLSATLGGTAFVLFNAGTGVHTVTRQSYELYVVRTDWTVDDVVQLTNVGGSLPPPLALLTDYYVVSVTEIGAYKTIEVSTTLRGSPITITGAGVGIHTVHRKYVNLSVTVLSQLQSALQLKVRSLSGTHYVISNPRFEIPATRDRLVLTCSIQYNDTYSLVGHDISTFTVSSLATYISGLRGYPDAIFEPLFRSEVIDYTYNNREATRLLDATGSSIADDTLLYAKLNDIVAVNLLNMYTTANVSVSTGELVAQSFGTVRASTPVDKDIYAWIDDTLYGSYTQGMTSIDILPVKVVDVTYGLPDTTTTPKQLTTGNTPAHVYFGVLGDIQWIQISDRNLHTQLNYVKERLGKPWKSSTGQILYDYYTPERYDINNPYAIDLANFIGYMRTVRYNQIKDSVINEAVVSNKYFWLYMKYHREIGCDQRAKALAKAISSRQTDQDMLGELS